jgi:hypothetical protein
MGEEQIRAGDSKSQNNLSAKDREGEQSSGIPRWLKIVAVVVPLVATLCAGIWAFMTWYSDLQKTREKERTQRLEQSQAELRLQTLKTEEQNSRERMSRQEIAQREKELSFKAKAVEAANQIQEDRDVASSIANLLAPGGKGQSEFGLASLVRYAAMDRHRDIIITALSATFKRIRTVEEAQLTINLARAIKPENFDLIAGANRVAMRYIADNLIAEFWHSYAPHIKEMSPRAFLEQLKHAGGPSGLSFISSLSAFYNNLTSDIWNRSPLRATGSLATPWESEEITRILKGLPSPDMVVFEAYSFILKQSADMLVGFIEAHKNEPLQLDISGCYFLHDPNIGSSSKIKLIRELKRDY